MYLALIGAGIGLLLGLIPLFLGMRKGKTRLGVIALVCSIVAGVFTSLISLVVVGVFIWLIYKGPAGTLAHSEEPASAEISDTDVEQ